MANITTVAIKLFLDGVLGVQAGLNNVRGGLGQVGQQAGAASGGADRLSAALGRVAHYGLAGGGLYALVRTAQGVGTALFDASASAQRLSTQLNFATSGRGAQEMAFVSGVAQRLGLELQSTAQAYAGFASAARGTALEGAGARQVFEGIAKASAVMGLSTEQSSGALLAVQQMMSKGVVSAEEFRGQLGERMPIALQAGANALGVTTAEFSKLLETGQIVAQDFLPKFSAAITEMLGDSVEQAANRLDAATARMGNAWDRLKRTVGDSGVSQAIANEATGIGNYLTSITDAMDRAKASGAGMSQQLLTGLGQVIARAPFDALSTAGNLLNGTLNTLSLGALDLNTHINLLPAALDTSAQQALVLERDLKAAEAELRALQERGAETSPNIYLRSSYFDTLRLAQGLRAAKEAQDALKGAASATGGGRGTVNPATVGELAAQQARLKADADAFRLKQSGVPDSYLKDMTELIRLNQAGALVGQEYTQALARQQAVLLKKTDTTQGAVAAQKTLQSAYESFLTGLHQKLGAQRQELDTGAKVSESDQLRIRLQELLGTSLKGLGAEQRKVLELGLQELAVGEKLARQYKQASELANARADARRQESQGIAQWLAEQEAAAQKGLADTRQRINALTMEEDAARLAASTNVSLAEAVELVAIARLQEAQAAKFHEGSEGWKAIEREIAARRELLGLVRGKEAREGIKKTADEAEKELKRVTEQYEQGLTNAAMQGGKSLREYIHGMLRTTAFRIVLDPIMKPLAGFLAGATGSASVAASQGGGIMGTANLLSSAYSALTTGVSSSITAGFAKLAGSSFGQSIGLSNSSAIMGNNPSAFVPAGGQLTPLGQSIGTGLGMLGSGLAGYGISSAISNGYTTGGNTVNVLSGIASAIPGIGPIAGVIGGLINRAFGRKLKDTGIEGTIGGAAGFEGNSYQFYKGGWFRSDKTVRGELDAGVDKSLDTAVKQMQLSMAGLAMAIGAPTEAISSFSQAIKLSFSGLDEAAIQEKITQALSDYNEGLASAFIASVDRSELPKWVDRLMGNVDASAVERLQAVAEWPAKLLQSFGTSRDQLAQLYAEGLARGDTAAAGQAVADSLVASIEASMLGNASAQVFDIVNQGIVTPMLDAIVLGQNVSEALSQASIQKTIERAKETAAAFAELWNNAEFTAALEDIRTTVGGALGNAGTALDYIPRYTQAVTDSGSAASNAAGALQGLQTETARLNIELLKAQGNAAAAAAAQRALDTAGFDDAAIAAYDLNAALRAQIDATNAAADAARQVAEERAGLESTLLQLLGDTTELRARELAALDASNRAIQQHIWAVQDSRAAYEAATGRAQGAYAALERSAGAAKSELQKQLDAEKASITARAQAARQGNEAQIAAARETASAIKGIASSLSAAVRTVQAESTAINFARLQNARSVLEGARGAADLSKVAGLESAIGVVGKDTTEFYATFEEWSYAQGVTAGTLRDLDSKAQAQLTTAEAIVQALGAQNDVAKALADAEIAAAEERFRIETGILDDTLNNAKQQLNALLGIDEGVLSMEAALGQFGAATSALAQQAAAAAAAAATAASTASSTAASAMKDALSGLEAAISSAIGTTGAGAGAGAAGKPSAKPESSAPSGLPPGTPWGVAQSPDAILGASKYSDADLRAMGFNTADLLAYTQLSQQSGVRGGLDRVVGNILRQGDEALWAAYGMQHLPTRTGPNGEVYTTLTDKTGKTYDSMKAWSESFTNAQRVAASEAWTNSAAGNGINPQELQTILQIGSTADRQLYWAGGSLDMGGFAAQDGKHYSSAAIVDAINTVLGQGASVQDVLHAGQANFGLNEEDIRTAARAAGIPGFAGGGDHLGGLRLVGELGPELEATGPARIWNATDTARMLRGDIAGTGSESLVAELQTLRRAVERLEALMAANNIDTRRHADQFDKVTAGGNAMAMEAL